MWLASTATSFSMFSACVMGYMLLFMPTLALANSVAMRHMQSPEKQFPLVRVAGSIGWIVAGLLIGVAGAVLVEAIWWVNRARTRARESSVHGADPAPSP